MTATLALPSGDLAWLTAICFLAGLVRGFTGFALSALVMATAVLFLPPIELIPMLWYLEMGASLMMLSGGLRDAHMPTAVLLVIGTWIGWPIGLSLTQSLPVDTSKLTTLAIIVTLAALQLARLRIPGLASRPGTVIAGVTAGIVSGLAHVGGMIVALYVLAQGSAARSMRGTLVIYLFLSSLGALGYQIWFGVMTETAAARGLAMLPATLLGVWIGSRLFNPRWEPFYRPVCLGLLIALAGAGLIRQGLSG
ncbi:MAG: sulfite exporter TauE/SafE family protein [Rhodobacteraceae bacterium]|nr:MAG: sulfite exporter TauE/SafE family protein [Paracoccaceae bacterium]